MSSTPGEQAFLQMINSGAPPCWRALGADVRHVDSEAGLAEVNFTMPLDYCHSRDVVQGGFVTGMLDATMTTAVFAMFQKIITLSSLEIKVSFLRPSRAGSFTCHGKVLRLGKSTAFLEGELFGSDGDLTATATSTAKIVRPK